MFFGFIWNNKPDKIKHMYITQDYQDAGLKMVNMEKFIDSPKLTWVYRLLKSQKADYHTLFETTISPISKFSKLGSGWAKLLTQKNLKHFLERKLVPQKWHFPKSF